MKASKYIGKTKTLIELPNLRFETPKLKVGNKYVIEDVEGSNFWIKDDEGVSVSIGSCRFELSENN